MSLSVSATLDRASPRALYSHGHDVIAVNTDETAGDDIAPHCSRAAVDDGREAAVLEEIGAAETIFPERDSGVNLASATAEDED